MANFIHLHFHSSFSFLDGFNPVDKAVARVKELGMTACAITDHNGLQGVYAFQQECKKQGIKPLLGAEMYYTPSMWDLTKPLEERREDAIALAVEAGEITYEWAHDKKTKKSEINEKVKDYMYDTTGHHILFIAKNRNGWHNLVKLTSEAAQYGKFNGRSHCDMELMRKYHEDIICTTACISSYSSHMLQQGKEAEAVRYLAELQEIFGEDFYLEIQPLDISKQWKTNLFYMDMAKELGIKVVATNDVHWTLKEDWHDHEVLLCVGTGKTIDDPNRMSYSNDFWIKSEAEMVESFEKQALSIVIAHTSPDGAECQLEDEDIEEYKEFYSQALAETANVAAKVDGDIKLGYDEAIFPEVKVPEGMTAESFLTYLTYQGLYRYLSAHPECNRLEYEARIYDELDVINTKGFAPYFLTVREYTNWCAENRILVGPGRGSAAGSLALFSLGITKLADPIKHGLWFSRFLTKDRVDPPDVDLDFQWSRRPDVIQHFKDYYGEEKVAHIGTFSVMGVKSGLTDVGRVLNVPLATVKKITKDLDEIMGNPAGGFEFKDLDKLAEENPDAHAKFKAIEDNNAEMFRLARAFEGTPRNTGVHASGILVTPMPVTDVTPVIYTKDGEAVTLFPKEPIEACGFVKLDILGLKTLDCIQKTLDSIGKNIDDLYEAINELNDTGIYKMIAQKKTGAIFQLSSDMMKGLVSDMQVSEFNDIVATNALGRPGPLSSGMGDNYSLVKAGKKEMEVPLRGTEDIFRETYGVPSYQEQLMQVSKEVSGFDDMQADSISRKIIAKKKKALWPLLLRCHIYGKINAEGPEGWEQDDSAPWYDPKGKYGGEIKGAVANGYTPQELLAYFDKIEGFASYCFNKSHAVSYSLISYMTAYLKKYHLTEFMAANLSVFGGDPDKLNALLDLTRKLGIKIQTPDINISGVDFTPNGNSILYGLSAVKGVGEAAVADLVMHQPYASLADVMERVPAKSFNKRIGVALIKAGAFDSFNLNRMEVINEFHNLRGKKDKDDLRYDASFYDENACMEMEQEALGAYVTYQPWWNTVEPGTTVEEICEVVSVNEMRDKRGGLMAKVTLRAHNSTFEGVVFASKYGPINDLFNNNFYLTVKGKKQEPNKWNPTGSLNISTAKKVEDAA